MSSRTSWLCLLSRQSTLCVSFAPSHACRCRTTTRGNVLKARYRDRNTRSLLVIHESSIHISGVHRILQVHDPTSQPPLGDVSSLTILPFPSNAVLLPSRLPLLLPHGTAASFNTHLIVRHLCVNVSNRHDLDNSNKTLLSEIDR